MTNKLNKVGQRRTESANIILDTIQTAKPKLQALGICKDTRAKACMNLGNRELSNISLGLKVSVLSTLIEEFMIVVDQRISKNFQGFLKLIVKFLNILNPN